MGEIEESNDASDMNINDDSDDINGQRDIRHNIGVLK